MAKTESLPAHLQEKGSGGDDQLTLYERHERPTACRSRPSLSNPRSTNDIVRAFSRANPTLLRSATNRVPIGYIGENSSAVNISKEVKFVKAKESVVVAPIVEKAKVEKKKIVADQRVLNKPRNQSVVRSKARGTSLPRSQRGPRTNHVCHHWGLQGHTRLNCRKLRALKNATNQRSKGPRNDKRTWAVQSSRG